MDTKTKDTISKRLLRILGSTKQTEQRLLDRYCQLYPPVLQRTETQRAKSKNTHYELRDIVRNVFHHLVENGYILKESKATEGDSTQVMYFQTNATRQQFESDRFQT